MTHDVLAENPRAARIAVSRLQLSDGREILYFDDADGEQRVRTADSRPSGTRAQTPEMRFDPISSEWISIAPDRNQRAHLPVESSCPLCIQTATNPSEVPGPFDVAVFENKNPSFGSELGDIREDISRFGARSAATGRCEVVVFSPDHHGSFGSQTELRMRTVISAWTHRTAELKNLPGVQVVFPFENRGEDIGVTLHHPHGQIYSYPFTPPRVEKILRSRQRHSGDFFGDYLSFEEGSNRLVERGDRFSVFVPFAPHWPVELVVMPHRPLGDFTELDEAESAELAVLLKRLFVSLEGFDDQPLPYISAWYQAPVGISGTDFRFHLRVTSPRRGPGKLKFPAGSETAMEAFISDVNPERQAERIRDLFGG